MQSIWLTQTKFAPPRLRDDLVPRDRLLRALLSAVESHALTLLSAPAGYGKTTLLASFSGQPTAWISLGNEDNDAAQFFLALVIALQHLDPEFGEDTRLLLSNLEDPARESRRLVSVLINELIGRLPAARLILDDLHLIHEPAIHLALDYLLEHLPSGVRLIFGTRHDPPLPLARLRARGMLAELRVPDLRFTTQESGTFLNDRQRLDLSPEDLRALQSRTEGWPAGLRLLAGSLDRIDSPGKRSAFVRDLAKTDRYVFDFLADEVLKRQEPEIRRFLLETSILPEISAPLCRALTDRADAPAILEQVYRGNLFLTQIEGTDRTYRYHLLFAEFLRGRLRDEYPDRFADLHRRAAEFHSTDSPGQAAIHYLAAELWDKAAGTIEAASEELLNHGMLQTMCGWIEALPASVRERRPRLLYLLGMSALQRGELEHAMAHLERARLGYESAADPQGQGETLLLMVDAASRGHDYVQQAALSEQAMGFPLPLHGQVHLLMAQAWQALFQGDPKQADAALEKALALTLASDEERPFHVVAPILNFTLAFLPGGMSRIERYSREVLARFGERPGTLQMCAHAQLAYLHFLQGSLDEAVRQAEQARAVSQAIGGFAYTDGQVHYVLAVDLAIRGDYAGMERYWSTRLPWIERTIAVQPFASAVLYMIGQMQWLQDDLERLRATEERTASRAGAKELPETLVARLVLRAIFEISDRRYDAAERTLQEALPILDRWPNAISFADPRITLAYLRLLQKREPEAWAVFGPLLAECERRGMPGLILREAGIVAPLLRLAVERDPQAGFARSLLDRLPGPGSLKPVPIPGSGEALTRRELEILRLIADGASNRAIAERLVISQHTVKVHVTNLLAKLEVGSRTQAVARARQLRLL